MPAPIARPPSPQRGNKKYRQLDSLRFKIKTETENETENEEHSVLSLAQDSIRYKIKTETENETEIDEHSVLSFFLSLSLNRGGTGIWIL